LRTSSSTAASARMPATPSSTRRDRQHLPERVSPAAQRVDLGSELRPWVERF
jgi:hypothetical protein